MHEGNGQIVSTPVSPGTPISVASQGSSTEFTTESVLKIHKFDSLPTLPGVTVNINT